MTNMCCGDCGELFNNCICPMVARFFEENGHLMEKKVEEIKKEKSKFFFVKGTGPLVSQ